MHRVSADIYVEFRLQYLPIEKFVENRGGIGHRNFKKISKGSNSDIFISLQSIRIAVSTVHVFGCLFLLMKFLFRQQEFNSSHGVLHYA